MRPILTHMVRRGEIRGIRDLPGIYEVTVPYARSGLIQEEEILMEIHPYAALSHLSALVFHGLTDELPQTITATTPSTGRAELLPPGTEPLDWESLAFVTGRKVPTILGQPVHWTSIKPSRYIGLHEYIPHGYPTRVTTPERTLLDCLLHPELCGGIENSLRAWVRARDLLDLDLIISLVEHLNIAILRQRAGFVLEELGFSHPVLGTWQKSARRGGSSKLVGSAAYDSAHSERWNLSLNGPVAVLREAS